MKTETSLVILNLLSSVLDTPYGIVVYTNDAHRARAEIYRVRKLIANPRFYEIQIRVSPDDSEHEIWLIRREQVNNHLSEIGHKNKT